MSAEDILATYEEHGPAWAAQRMHHMLEIPWLDQLLGVCDAPEILDVGCGSGAPLAVYLDSAGARVTGVDGAASMVAEFRATLPQCTVHHADMRSLDLGRRFDGILAWDSFFHLSSEAQRWMFAIFGAHARPGARLVFTSGPSASESYGTVNGAPVFHASLDPEEYRALLDGGGFDVLSYSPEDPNCDRHTIWCAQKRY